MTEHGRGIGPMPPAGVEGSAATSAPSAGLLGLRTAGALLGAIIAAVAETAAARLDALVADPLDSPIAVVFGPDGIGHGEPLGSLLVWAVGPIAAAVAGGIFAVAAARRVDGAGLWMGATTYVLAIGLSPATLLPEMARVAGPALSSLAGLPFLWLAAGAALAPLLAVCLVAGPIWAVALRALTGGALRGWSHRTLPIWPVVALAVLTLVGWILVTAALHVVGTEVID